MGPAGGAGGASADDSSIRSIPAQGPFTGKPVTARRLPDFTASLRGLLAMLALAVTLGGCAHPPDEEALRDRIAEMQSAIEARDADALADAVAVDFSGPEGMDRSGLRRYAALMLLRQQRVGVVLGPIEVTLHGDRATARFDAMVSGAEGLLPQGLEARRVDTTWRRDGGDWVLVAADWRSPARGG